MTDQLLNMCKFKMNVDIDILVTNHAIYQNNQYTSLKIKEVEPVESFQMNIYQSNNYRKDLSWLHFNCEPEVQERQQQFLSNNSK